MPFLPGWLPITPESLHLRAVCTNLSHLYTSIYFPCKNHGKGEHAWHTSQEMRPPHFSFFCQYIKYRLRIHEKIQAKLSSFLARSAEASCLWIFLSSQFTPASVGESLPVTYFSGEWTSDFWQRPQGQHLIVLSEALTHTILFKGVYLPHWLLALDFLSLQAGHLLSVELCLGLTLQRELRQLYSPIFPPPGLCWLRICRHGCSNASCPRATLHRTNSLVFMIANGQLIPQNPYTTHF